MDALEVIVLGCGGSSGVPMLGGPDGRGNWGECDPTEPRNRRTRSSIVLRSPGGESLLVDTGPDLRGQLLAAGVGSFDAIFYTHAHADHIAGLDDVRTINWALRRPIEAYGTADTLEEVQMRFDYAFQPWTIAEFYRPGIVACPVLPDTTLEVAGLKLDLFEQDHGRRTSLGFRCGGFAYCTDVAVLSEPVLSRLEGVDTWMVDCFQKTPHGAHGWVDRVLEWHERIGARRTILTHMGPSMDWSWMEATLPPDVEPAFDGMRIQIPQG